MHIKLPMLSMQCSTKKSTNGWQLPLPHRPENLHTRMALITGGLLVLISLGCAWMPSPLMLIACLVVLTITIGAIFQPRFALLLLFLSAGLPSITLPLPGHNMHLVEPVTVLLLLVIMVHRPHVRFTIPHFLYIFFLILAAISFIHVPEITGNASIYAADKRLVTLAITGALFFAGTWLAKTIGDGVTFLLSILLVSLPLYGVGLAQALGVHLPPLLEAPAASNAHITQGRLWGPFPWSVNLGMYLVNLMAIAVVCWLQGTRRSHKVIGFVLTVATALAIVGSGTRSATLAAMVVIMVACLMCRRGIMLGFSFLLATGVSVSFFAKIVSLFSHDASSTDNRLLLWNEAIKLIIAHPWLGIGLQQFHYYYAQLIVGRATELDPLGIHPHEQYLEWAVESGILSSLVGVLLLLSIIVMCWRAYHSGASRQKNIILVVLLAMLGNSIMGLLDAPFDQLEGASVLFLLAGLAIGMAKNAEAAEQEKSSKGSASVMICRVPRRSSLHLSAKHTPRLPASTGAAEDGETRFRMSAKTSRAIGIQLLSWGLAIPLIFPMTALLTRYLGPSQYGEYSLTFPFLAVFALLSGTGMDQLIIRQLSRQPRRAWSETLSYAVGTRTVSTGLSIGLAVITAWLLPIGSEQRSLFLLGCVSLMFSFSFNGLRMIYSHGFRAEQSVGLLALFETSNRIITASLIALIVWLHWPLLWSYALLIYSDIPMFFIQLIFASRRYSIHIRFSLTHFRQHMQASLPLLGHGALILLTGQIDICLLMVVAGPASAGIYALASRITDPLISIAFAYVNGLYPLLCMSFDKGRETFNHVCYQATCLLALAIIPLAICVSTQANVLVNLLGGQRFAAATIAVQWLMGTMVLTFFNQLGERICMAANVEQKVPMVTAVSTSINLLLNIALVPHWQILGASLTALVSEAVGLSLFVIQVREYIRLWPMAAMLGLVLLSNLPSLVLLLWQHDLSLLLSLPLVLVLTIAGYLITGILSFTESDNATPMLDLASLSRGAGDSVP